MQPGDVPECLKALSFMEELLIARFIPCMYICRLRGGGQFAYRNHVIAFPQDIQSIVNELPRTPAATQLLLVRKPGKNNTHKDFRVRRGHVVAALEWLMQHNPLYAQIRIRQDIVAQLPEDGVPSDMPAVPEDVNNVEVEEMADIVDPERAVEEAESVVTGIADAVDGRREVNKIRDCLQWPPQAQEPASEYNTVGLWTMAYPTLFPTGAADITNFTANQISRDVDLSDWAKFLMQWKDECAPGFNCVGLSFLILKPKAFHIQ